MNHLLRFPVSVILVFLVVFGLEGCNQESAAGNAAVSSAPLSELDKSINDYEKVTKEYVRVAKKHQAGDVSITMLYIELEENIRTSATKLKQESAKMTPPQAQRVASISAKTAPYLQN